MISGSFLIDEGLPVIQVPVSFGSTVLYLSCILDTDFSGDLKIDEQTATELGIVSPGVGKFTNANGELVLAGTAQGYAEMEGKKAPVTIIIKKGAHLAGIGLFSVFGYRAVVDCKKKEAYRE
jgi:predicted aspartyl protease